MVTPRPRTTTRILRVDPMATGRRVVDVVGAGRGKLRSITPLGATVLAIGVAAWVVGWRLGWAEFMVVAAACWLAVAFAVMFVVGRMTMRVDITLDPARVVVGTPAAGRVRVTNTARARMLPLAVAVPVGTGVATFRVPSLASGATHDDLFIVPSKRRAVIPVGPATSVRADPVGLLSRQAPLTERIELFIHPTTLPLASMGAGILRDLEGCETNATVMNDLAFHALREYVPGDAMRNVHWRTSARTGRLMVRQFVDTRRSHLLILLDACTASYGAADDFEAAVSAAGSAALRALADGQQATLLADRWVVADGTRQRLLDTLSRVELTVADAELAAFCGRGAQAARDATVVLLVTGALVGVDTIRQALRRFSADVKALALQVDPTGTAAVRSVGGLTVVTLVTLDDLPRLLRRASAA